MTVRENRVPEITHGAFKRSSFRIASNTSDASSGTRVHERELGSSNIAFATLRQMKERL
jgi:hypothetical protein